MKHLVRWTIAAVSVLAATLALALPGGTVRAPAAAADKGWSSLTLRFGAG